MMWSKLAFFIFHDELLKRPSPILVADYYLVHYIPMPREVSCIIYFLSDYWLFATFDICFLRC
uniref:Uncharacterized protein n=1 Tax=Rhizophora mucronata TaxID=61149 RepID=A0A2P2P0X6_RHIMU